MLSIKHKRPSLYKTLHTTIRIMRAYFAAIGFVVIKHSLTVIRFVFISLGMNCLDKIAFLKMLHLA